MAKAKERQATGSAAGRRVVRQYSEQLETVLTAEEAWDRAAKACELMCEYQKVEIEKKFAMKEFGQQLKKLRKEADSHSVAVHTGRVYKEVQIEEIYDFAEDVVYRVRVDTGEVIVKRKPTEAERQESFEFGAVQ